MAAPTTPILSSFTGADENPLSEGGNWAILYNLGATQALRRVSNQVGTPTGFNSGADRWAATTFAADQECYATLSAVGAVFNAQGLLVRAVNPGATTWNGYLLRVQFPQVFPGAPSLLPITGIGGPNGQSYPGTLNLLCKAGGTLGTITRNESVGAVITAGDKIWLYAQGSTIIAYHNAGGGWDERIRWTDTTLAGGGQVGVYFETQNGLARMDDFGGGNV